MSSSRLDQSEVDALMAAIQEGRVSSEAGGPGGGPVMSYDLTNQDRIIRGQMPTLDSIDDRTASLFGGALAARIRLDIRVMATPATLLKFVDVSALLTPPATVGMMTLGPGHGLAVATLEHTLARALVAGALGDRKARADSVDPVDGKSDLTNVERLVLRHVLSLFCDAMSQSWAEILPIHPELLRFESDPRMAMIAAPSDLALLCGYELSGAASGRLQVIIPYATVEPVKKALSSPPRQSGAVDERMSALLAREISQVEVEMRAEIGRARLPFSQLLELQVGDLITLDQNESAPIPIYIEGKRKLTGWPRVSSGSMAVVIEQAPTLPKRKSGLPKRDGTTPA
ncbi:MAG: FliM/FliN family flagellar motor switch protein [Deltaproteobacteria bacterium]|nr:FliM/FliN family flagellar motor switch protein [Deltaproteobacteria bacterium]